ncbi:MAG: hypothetical protein ACYC9Y_00120 [Candidatus Methylomirabilia bacterium]
MSRKFAVLAVFCVMVLAAFAGCSSDSTGSSNAKADFTGGKWLTQDISGGDYDWGVVFREDNIFDGYLGAETTVKITGPYAVDGNGNVTGDWVSNTSSRIGKIEAHLENNKTILYFKFIETNAFDNPHAVNGVVFTESRGPNPTKS